MPFKPSGATLLDNAREEADTGFGPGQAAAGGVTSVAGRVGVVTLTEADIASLVADLAAKLVKASNLSDLVDAAAARGNLGLGTAATHATGDYDAAGAAAAAQAAAIVASLQRASNLSDLASAATARGNLGVRLMQGAYAAGTAYAVGDLAFYQGALYVCIQAGTGHTPSTSATFWTALAGDTAWTAVTYVNGWADSGAINPGAFRKDALGFVHLKGLASRGAGASAATIFTLPAGYRPLNAVFYPSINIAHTLNGVDISAAGDASLLDADTQITLDGATFLAEN